MNSKLAIEVAMALVRQTRGQTGGDRKTNRMTEKQQLTLNGNTELRFQQARLSILICIFCKFQAKI